MGFSLFGPKYNYKCAHCGYRNKLTKSEFYSGYKKKKKCVACHKVTTVTP